MLTKEENARLNELNSFANRLPVAYTYNDIEAMNIVQEAAEYLKKQKE
jgi:N-acetylglucosamine kinase-like BadF-type ATPase